MLAALSFTSLSVGPPMWSYRGAYQAHWASSLCDDGTSLACRQGGGVRKGDGLIAGGEEIVLV